MANTTEKTAAPTGQVRDAGMPVGQAPTVSRPRPPTVEERRRGAYDGLFAMVEDRTDEITVFLREFDVTFDFFKAALAIAMNGTMRNDPEFFLAVKPSTFFEALFYILRNRLLPDGKQAAIARFADTATPLIMRDGIVKRLHETGLIRDINDGLIMPGDEFEWQEGSEAFIRHLPSLDRKMDEEPRGAYVVIRTTNGGEYREVVPKADLAKIRSVSRATKGPRKDWPLEMDRKAPLRRIVKRLPQDPAFKAIRDMIEKEDEIYAQVPAEEEKRPAVAHDIYSDGDETPAAETQRKPALRRAKGDPKPSKSKRTPKQPVKEPEPEREAVAQELRESHLPRFQKMVADAEAMSDLGLVEHEMRSTPEGAALTEDERLSLFDLIGKRKIAIAQMGNAGAKPVPVFDGTLYAVLRSTDHRPREYSDPQIWLADMMTKFSGLKGDPLVAFWSHNRQFIRDAADADVKEAKTLWAKAVEKKLEEQ